eukprot:361240-Ditylum_brightwellii.AAC.1
MTGMLSKQHAYKGFIVDEILAEGGESVNDEFRHARNVLMGQKGLNPSATADNQQLQVSDYIVFICPPK